MIAGRSVAFLMMMIDWFIIYFHEQQETTRSHTRLREEKIEVLAKREECGGTKNARALKRACKRKTTRLFSARPFVDCLVQREYPHWQSQSVKSTRSQGSIPCITIHHKTVQQEGEKARLSANNNGGRKRKEHQQKETEALKEQKKKSEGRTAIKKEQEGKKSATTRKRRRGEEWNDEKEAEKRKMQQYEEKKKSKQNQRRREKEERKQEGRGREDKEDRDMERKSKRNITKRERVGRRKGGLKRVVWFSDDGYHDVKTGRKQKERRVYGHAESILDRKDKQSYNTSSFSAFSSASWWFLVIDNNLCSWFWSLTTRDNNSKQQSQAEDREKEKIEVLTKGEESGGTKNVRALKRVCKSEKPQGYFLLVVHSSMDLFGDDIHIDKAKP